MATAVTRGLKQIDRVGQEGDLVADPTDPLPVVDPEDAGIAIELPERDGPRTIYMPQVMGVPVHELACSLLDFDHPSRSKYLRLIGPPGTGKSQIGRAIAKHAWEARGRKVEDRDGQPFYGYVEISGGPSSDEYTFKYEFCPSAEDAGNVQLIDALFVKGMLEGWVVMIDEPNTIRDVALGSLNGVFDGRLSLYLPALGRNVVAKPGFGCLLGYNPGQTSAISDLPEAWYSRFPAAIEVCSNWPGLVKAGAPERLVAAARDLDRRRLCGEEGLVWTPQYREIESLWQMMERVGERHAISLFITSLRERMEVGRISEAELTAACRMLDLGGFDHCQVTASSGIPRVQSYPRAITGTLR
jgi:hypothetical protein